MDEILKQTLLYDFYGELLTKHQKEIYEQAVLEDYSLSEIARDAGISRQGVHDIIRRCDASLEGYENKLGLISRYEKIKADFEDMKKMIGRYEITGDYDKYRFCADIRKTAESITEQL